MELYPITLFLHVTGALGLFIGMGMEWVTLRHFCQVTTASEALRWKKTFGILKGIFISSGLLVLLPGLYMVFDRWGWTAWVIFGLILWFALAMFGNVIVGKKIMGIIKPLKETDGLLSAETQKKLRDPFVHKSLIVRMMLALGIVFTMVEKPGSAETIIALVSAAVIGLLIVVPSKSEELSSAAEG